MTDSPVFDSMPLLPQPQEPLFTPDQHRLAPTKRESGSEIKSVLVTFANKSATEWTRDGDGLGDVQISESNVLVLEDLQGRTMTIISPLVWVDVTIAYADAAA